MTSSYTGALSSSNIANNNENENNVYRNTSNTTGNLSGWQGIHPDHLLHIDRRDDMRFVYSLHANFLTLKRPTGVLWYPSHVSCWTTFGLFKIFKSGFVNLLIGYHFLFLVNKTRFISKAFFYIVYILLGSPGTPFDFSFTK
jgi:hypothetical protein